MIRYALAFLGLSAGAVSAQSMMPAALIGASEQVAVHAAVEVRVEDEIVTPQTVEPAGADPEPALDGSTTLLAEASLVQSMRPNSGDQAADPIDVAFRGDVATAAALSCGGMAFGLGRLKRVTVDGSDPSADFCP